MAEILGIEVRRHNMYQTGKVYNFPEDGEKLLIREKIVYKPSLFDISHPVKNNDTLWGIAYKYYRDKIGSPSNWYIIADANDIFNPYDITSLHGKNIIIPDISNVALTN